MTIRSAVLSVASVAVLFTTTLVAHADPYTFSFSGGGMSGSGVLTVSNAVVPGVPGALQITGISGTFSDSNLGLSNVMITGIQSTALPSGINADGTFVPPGSQADGYGFSYDNLLYPGGNSPAVCPPDPSDPAGNYPFGGGLLDIYGMLFDVQGGYTVDLWSNGVVPGFGLTYGVGDALDGNVESTFGEPFSGTSADVSIAPTPEPSTLLFLGTGLLGVAGAARRRLFKK